MFTCKYTHTNGADVLKQRLQYGHHKTIKRWIPNESNYLTRFYRIDGLDRENLITKDSLGFRVFNMSLQDQLTLEKCVLSW